MDLREQKDEANRQFVSGRYHRAAELYLHLIRQEGRDPGLRLRYAEVCKRLGWRDPMVVSYRTAAELFRRAGQLSRARGVVRVALEAAPGHAALQKLWEGLAAPEAQAIPTLRRPAVAPEVPEASTHRLRAQESAELELDVQVEAPVSEIPAAVPTPLGEHPLPASSAPAAEPGGVRVLGACPSPAVLAAPPAVVIDAAVPAPLSVWDVEDLGASRESATPDFPSSATEPQQIAPEVDPFDALIRRLERRGLGPPASEDAADRQATFVWPPPAARVAGARPSPAPFATPWPPAADRLATGRWPPLPGGEGGGELCTEPGLSLGRAAVDEPGRGVKTDPERAAEVMVPAALAERTADSSGRTRRIRAPLASGAVAAESRTDPGSPMPDSGPCAGAQTVLAGPAAVSRRRPSGPQPPAGAHPQGPTLPPAPPRPEASGPKAAPLRRPSGQPRLFTPTSPEPARAPTTAAAELEAPPRPAFSPLPPRPA